MTDSDKLEKIKDERDAWRKRAEDAEAPHADAERLLREAREDLSEAWQMANILPDRSAELMDRIDAHLSSPASKESAAIVQVLPLPPQPATITTATHPGPWVAAPAPQTGLPERAQRLCADLEGNLPPHDNGYLVLADDYNELYSFCEHQQAALDQKVSECEGLRKLFKKATGYTVPEYETMVREISNER